MKRLAVTAGRVMTPDRVILDGVVLVEDAKILEVGSRAAVRFSQDEFEVVGHSRLTAGSRLHRYSHPRCTGAGCDGRHRRGG